MYLFVVFCQFFSLINYRTQHLLWTNVTGGPKLEDVRKLRFLSISATLGIISTACYTVSAIFLFTEASELMLLWADGLIVTILASLSGLFAIRKESTFFDEVLHGMPLHRRNVSS